MESIIILRELWRLRLLVILGALLAVMCAVLVSYRVSLPSLKLESRQYHVGIASARMLIDTPASQVVDLNPKGADTLNARASLLANLMVSAPVKSIIARDAGVPADRLIAIAPTAPGSGGPTVPTTLSQKASEASKTPGAYLLTLQSDETLPIVSIDAQAPTAAAAARLANAATTGLRDYLRSVAGAQNLPATRQIVVSGLGGAQAADQVRGPRKLFAIAAFVFVFGFACFAIIMISGIARGWRRAAALERTLLVRSFVDVGAGGAAAVAPSRPAGAATPEARGGTQRRRPHRRERKRPQDGDRRALERALLRRPRGEQAHERSALERRAPRGRERADHRRALRRRARQRPAHRQQALGRTPAGRAGRSAGPLRSGSGARERRSLGPQGHEAIARLGRQAPQLRPRAPGRRRHGAAVEVTRADEAHVGVGAAERR